MTDPVVTDADREAARESQWPHHVQAREALERALAAARVAGMVEARRLALNHATCATHSAHTRCPQAIAAEISEAIAHPTRAQDGAQA